MTMPIDAPRPVPTMMAVGVARPKAHGQAMINTLQTLLASPAHVAAAGQPCVAPQTYQPTPVSSAIKSTLGTKMAEIRSASRCTRGLLFCAVSTSCTI